MEIELTDYIYDGANRNPYSFYNTVDFGANDDDRYIVILAFITSSAGVSSVNISNQTTDYTAKGTDGSNSWVIACAKYTTNDANNRIVIYTSGTGTSCTIFVYRVIGIVDTAPSDYGDASASLSTSLDTPKGSAVFGLAVYDEDGFSPAWSGGGLSSDMSPHPNSNEYSVASGTPSETTINETISCTPQGTSTFRAIIAASFPGFSPLTNPGNAYASDNTYATCAATSGDLKVELSVDGGNSYGTAITETFTSTEAEQTYGDGSTELWGLSPTRADMVDGTFRLRVSHGSYMHVFDDFGFTTGSDIITGIEVKVEAKYASSTISIDLITVKIYYGTSDLTIQEGSVAFATDGRKNGETAGNGTGVLCFHDGSTWNAVDSGDAVEA